MRPSLVVPAVAAVVLAAVGAAHLQAASRVPQAGSPFLPTPPAGGPRQILIYAHIKSAAAKGGRFEVKVDPAEYLSGATANQAAIADKLIPPGDVVPNDHYIRDEGHKLLVYKIPAKARITVITNDGTTGPVATAISPAELTQIVRGKNPNRRHLFEPKNGFWIRVASDTALSLDQQYSP
jgi:hypothetical protein